MSATPQDGPAPAAGTQTERGPAGAREEVLAAAARAFMERGFAETSIDDVARRMGATKGRVYHYYRSKLELFNDVTRRSLERIHGEVAAAEAGGGSPRERLERMCRAHVRSILVDQPWHRAALQGVEMHLRRDASPAQRAAVADLIRLRDRHETLFRRVMEEGIAAGELRPCDVAVTVRTLMPALNGPVFWYRSRDGEAEADVARITNETVAFALGGLAAPHPIPEGGDPR
ncbi:MAG: TetR/AcrR family transcriptional regulator [Pseudomonadota bacterium]